MIVHRMAPLRMWSDCLAASSAGKKRYCACSVALVCALQKKRFCSQQPRGGWLRWISSMGRHTPRAQIGLSATKRQREARYEHHVLEAQSARSGRSAEAITRKSTCASESAEPPCLSRSSLVRLPSPAEPTRAATPRALFSAWSDDWSASSNSINLSSRRRTYIRRACQGAGHRCLWEPKCPFCAPS